MFVAPTVLAQDAEVQFHKTSRLSGSEQIAQAQQYLASMNTILGQVNKLADRARQEKDIIKLNCVNDKLVQVKGSINVGEGIYKTLQAANARNDQAERDHEFAKLTITYQKVTVLRQEAEACIGEEIAYVGKTRVDIQVDPDVTRQGDPTVEPPPELPVFRPPVASPFM